MSVSTEEFDEIMQEEIDVSKVEKHESVKYEAAPGEGVEVDGKAEDVKIEKDVTALEIGLKRRREKCPLPNDYLKKMAPARNQEGNRIDREEWIEGREAAARSEGFLELEYEPGSVRFKEARVQLEEGMKAGTFSRLTTQFQQMQR